MQAPEITIITPTTGKDSLSRLTNSLRYQRASFVHLLLWDDKREGEFLYPDSDNYGITQPEELDYVATYMKDGECYSQVGHNIVLPGNLVSGKAYGSALRAVGLMAANTPYVTFSDDDVWYDENHLAEMLKAVRGKKWARTIRRIWGDVCFGEDRFESVGEDAKTPYKMVDNSSMIFDRRFGSSAACLYRETIEYNDDRLMYAFLKKHAGECGFTDKCTVNQVCPERLVEWFKTNCTECSRTGESLANGN